MLIEETLSKYSGNLQVLNTFPWSQPYISTGYLTQSGGLVHDVWKPIIKLIKNYDNNLILGLAGGTLAKLLNKANPEAKITGVEIDPAMIYLGKKYLDLDKIPNLKIVQADAYSYIINRKSNFDVIFVDLYQNDQIPEFVYTQKFLTKLTRSAKLIIFNHLFYDDTKKSNAKKLIDKCQMLNYQITLKRVLTNLIIIASPKTHPVTHTPPPQTFF